MVTAGISCRRAASRLMFTVANIDQPVSHPNHFLSIGLAFDQDDEIDIAVRGHGAPGAGSDENDSDQVAAAFRANVFHGAGQGLVVARRRHCRRHLWWFGNIQ